MLVIWNVLCGLKILDGIGVSRSFHDSFDRCGLMKLDLLLNVREIFVSVMSRSLELFSFHNFEFLFHHILPLSWWELAWWGGLWTVWLFYWAEEFGRLLMWRRGWDEVANVWQEFALHCVDVAKWLWNCGWLCDVKLLIAICICAVVLVVKKSASTILYLLIRLAALVYAERSPLVPPGLLTLPITDVHDPYNEQDA